MLGSLLNCLEMCLLPCLILMGNSGRFPIEIVSIDFSVSLPLLLQESWKGDARAGKPTSAFSPVVATPPCRLLERTEVPFTPPPIPQPYRKTQLAAAKRLEKDLKNQNCGGGGKKKDKSKASARPRPKARPKARPASLSLQKDQWRKP